MKIWLIIVSFFFLMNSHCDMYSVKNYLFSFMSRENIIWIFFRLPRILVERDGGTMVVIRRELFLPLCAITESFGACTCIYFPFSIKNNKKNIAGCRFITYWSGVKPHHWRLINLVKCCLNLVICTCAQIFCYFLSLVFANELIVAWPFKKSPSNSCGFDFQITTLQWNTVQKEYRNHIHHLWYSAEYRSYAGFLPFHTKNL